MEIATSQDRAIVVFLLHCKNANVLVTHSRHTKNSTIRYWTFGPATSNFSRPSENLINPIPHPYRSFNPGDCFEIGCVLKGCPSFKTYNLCVKSSGNVLCLLLGYCKGGGVRDSGFRFQIELDSGFKFRTVF